MMSLYKWDGVGTVINSNDDEVEVDIDIGYDIEGDDVGRFAATIIKLLTSMIRAI